MHGDGDYFAFVKRERILIIYPAAGADEACGFRGDLGIDVAFDVFEIEGRAGDLARIKISPIVHIRITVIDNVARGLGFEPWNIAPAIVGDLIGID